MSDIQPTELRNTLETLAQRFVAAMADVPTTANKKEAVDHLFARYNGVKMIMLRRNDEHIGNRFVHADRSFVDFYFSAPDKCFFGTDANIEIEGESGIVGTDGKLIQ